MVALAIIHNTPFRGTTDDYVTEMGDDSLSQISKLAAANV